MEARSVRCMGDVCAAHGDRSAVGVDDAQGSGLREDDTHFPLNAGVECRAFVSERILVGLACRKGGSIPRFPDEPEGKVDVEVRSELRHPLVLATPGINDALLLLLFAA